jgi:hypothetical protein
MAEAQVNSQLQVRLLLMLLTVQSIPTRESLLAGTMLKMIML